jgi:hypothetical protein
VNPDPPDPEREDLEAAVNAVFSLESDDEHLDPEEDWLPWWARKLGPQDWEAIRQSREEAPPPDDERGES